MMCIIEMDVSWSWEGMRMMGGVDRWMCDGEDEASSAFMSRPELMHTADAMHLNTILSNALIH